MDDDGRIWSCGDRGYLGDECKEIHTPTIVPWFVEERVRIVDIANGGCHNLALSDDGKVYVFGSNNYGQCGRVSKKYYTPGEITTLRRLKHKIVEIGCGDWHSYCKNENGEWFLWGMDEFNECLGYYDGVVKGHQVPIVNEPTCINDTVAEWIGDEKEIVLINCGNRNTKFVIKNR